MNSKRKKAVQKPKQDALATIERQAAVSSPDAVDKASIAMKISQAAEQGFSNWMKQVFGTEDKPLQHRLLYQASRAVPDFTGQEKQSFDHVTAALHGIGPRDSLEGMLAVQMVAAHTMAMECMRRAALPNQIDLAVEVNLNRGTRLMRTFASLTEALGRYRGKGEQKMIVEHVHVHKGGQAIVGAVSQTNTQNNRM